MKIMRSIFGVSDIHARLIKMVRNVETTVVRSRHPKVVFPCVGQPPPPHHQVGRNLELDQKERMERSEI
jgi:hypothetical protein